MQWHRIQIEKNDDAHVVVMPCDSANHPPTAQAHRAVRRNVKNIRRGLGGEADNSIRERK